MILSDHDIHRELIQAAGHAVDEIQGLAITPYDPDRLQPCSYDLILDRYFRIFDSHRAVCIDPARSQQGLTRLVTPGPEQPFVLHPGEFALGSTVETVSIPTWLAGRVEGKSSLGRLGIVVHSTAGWLDPGFTGTVTLELSCHVPVPVVLWPGMAIAQLCLFRLETQADLPYGPLRGSHYQDQQRGPVESRAWDGWRVWDVPEDAPPTLLVVPNPRGGEKCAKLSLLRCLPLAWRLVRRPSWATLLPHRSMATSRRPSSVIRTSARAAARERAAAAGDRLRLTSSRRV